MVVDESMLDEVVELLEQKLPERMVVEPDDVRNGVELRDVSNANYEMTEIVRPLGITIMEETGYAITGFRVMDDWTSVWFDPIPNQETTDDPTVAQRAARIIREQGESATIEANVSSEPKEQYVDVYPHPHRMSTENWSLRDETLREIEDAGLRLRHMSLGRKRGEFSGETHRVWFEERGDE